MNRHIPKKDIQMTNKDIKIPNIISHQGNTNQNLKEIPLNRQARYWITHNPWGYVARNSQLRISIENHLCYFLLISLLSFYWLLYLLLPRWCLDCVLTLSLPHTTKQSWARTVPTTSLLESGSTSTILIAPINFSFELRPKINVIS